MPKKKDKIRSKSGSYSSRGSAAFRWRILRFKIRYRITFPFRYMGKFLSRIFTIYRVAFLLIIVAIILWYFNEISFEELLPNIITDLLGVALTVFIIDTMYRLRSDTERKRILIEKLGSKNNSVATEALHEINAQGWLYDGSLNRASLLSCNLDGNSFSGADIRQARLAFASLRDTNWVEASLQGAWLDHVNLSNATLTMYEPEINRHIEADLTGASLYMANLKGAKIRHEQLCKVKSLWKTVMPDGQIYDGRYNLLPDIERFLKFAKNPGDPKEWADYYGISIAQYMNGQLWASKNLERLKQSVSA